MNGYLGDAVALLFFCALIYVLVRPGSKGQDLVKAAGALVTAVVLQATDITTT